MAFEKFFLIISREDNKMFGELPCLSAKRNFRSKKKLQRVYQRQKQNGFVLDCLNKQKSLLKHYNATSDKYLKYFVIKVKPSRKKSPNKELTDWDEVEQKNHKQFQSMLLQQKQKIMQCKSQKNIDASTPLTCIREDRSDSRRMCHPCHPVEEQNIHQRLENFAKSKVEVENIVIQEDF